MRLKTISHDKILLQSQGVTVTWKVLDGLLILCLRWSRHESQPLQQLRPEPKSKWMGRAFRLLASLWAAACFYFLLPRASGLQEKKVLGALGGGRGGEVLVCALFVAHLEVLQLCLHG